MPEDTVVVQSLSRVWLLVTPWTAAWQAFLWSTVSWSLCKLISIRSVMPSNDFMLCHPLLLLPSIFHRTRVFPKSWLFVSGGKSIGASASEPVLPMNMQGWSPLGLTGLIFLQSKRLSRVFSSITLQKHQFFSLQSSLWSNSHIYALLLGKP